MLSSNGLPRALSADVVPYVFCASILPAVTLRYPWGVGVAIKNYRYRSRGKTKKTSITQKKMIFIFAIRFTWPMEEIQFLNGYVRWDLIVHINMYVDRAANKLNLSLRRTVYSIVKWYPLSLLLPVATLRLKIHHCTTSWKRSLWTMQKYRS